jgi:hypothetical protein
MHVSGKHMLAVAGGVAATVPIAARMAWQRDSRRLERELLRHENGSPGLVTNEQLGDLPPPVRTFLSRTLREGQHLIRTARTTQSGEFQLNGAWRRMRAHQLFSAVPAGFVWDARIYASPLLPVFVRDSYVAGRAAMKARLLAVYPVVSQSGDPKLNAGALLRYLGEAAWLPTRMLPGHGLSWAAIDARAARATLVDGDISVSLEFRFADNGDLVELYAPDRFREVDGEYVPTPWRVRSLGYAVVDGVRLMSPSVAEWLLPEGPMPYWRGRILRLEQHVTA